MADRIEDGSRLPWFVGIQTSPINFVDEGVDELLDSFKNRFGINAIMIGTVSWLGLKVGRRVSSALEGWPDHGATTDSRVYGGSYLHSRPQFYENTIIKEFRAQDPALEGADILEMVLPGAHHRSMKVYADLMEPMLKYVGHGSSEAVDIANLPSLLQIDVLGRIGGEPCLNNIDYRNWLHDVIEDHCRNYNIDGIMWCNERRSPLDAALTGVAPHCFCPSCTLMASRAGIDIGRAREGMQRVWEFTTAAKDGQEFDDGTFVEFLRVVYSNPEILQWEKFWVESNKELDRELYGIAKFCNSKVEFGLNVWNRNHLNPWRKAQWPWREQAQWADWVKPIVYQHQTGGIFWNEWTPLLSTIFRDLDADGVIEHVKSLLGLRVGAWHDLVPRGFDAETYTFDQCRDTIKGLDGKLPVYMGIGVDAPRTRSDQAVCTPEIIRTSVLATDRAGGQGVIFGPAYSGMNLRTLDGAADAFRELGILPSAVGG